MVHRPYPDTTLLNHPGHTQKKSYREKGWHVSEEKYLTRLKDQEEGRCISVVAEHEGSVAGYVNLYFHQLKGPFASLGYLSDFHPLCQCGKEISGKGIPRRRRIHHRRRIRLLLCPSLRRIAYRSLFPQCHHHAQPGILSMDELPGCIRIGGISMKILNFGSLNLDYVYQVEHFVQPGETLSALSQSVNCALPSFPWLLPPPPSPADSSPHSAAPDNRPARTSP